MAIYDILYLPRDVRATANIIKASLGSGLLAGPLAFSNSGWGVGICGTILVGLICGHCIHILVRLHFNFLKNLMLKTPFHGL